MARLTRGRFTAGRSGAVAVTVAPTGRLERALCDASYRAITMLSVVPGADITVDLRDVPSLDETSAQLIADAQSRTRRHGGRFTVLSARSQPCEALRAVGAGGEGPALLVTP
jgi:anti-anti-sigma regulatory factor